MGDFDSDTIEAVARLVRSTGEPKIIEHGNIPFAVIPVDAKLESLERYVFNEHADQPERVKANVNVLDPASFIEYYELFSDDASRVFAYEPNISVTGVIDYHDPTSDAPAQWCQHRVTLTLRQSEEWKTWIGKNNKQFTQMEFAEFLEQNAIDITTPSAATMMEVARDLTAHTEVDFAAGTRTNDGQVRFKYTETKTASVGTGQVAVPEQFIIAIPAFVGGQRVAMQALLRFRVKENKLVLWFTLVRPEEVLRTAFTAARDSIAEAIKAKIINGLPGAQ